MKEQTADGWWNDDYPDLNQIKLDLVIFPIDMKWRIEPVIVDHY